MFMVSPDSQFLLAQLLLTGPHRSTNVHEYIPNLCYVKGRVQDRIINIAQSQQHLQLFLTILMPTSV